MMDFLRNSKSMTMLWKGAMVILPLSFLISGMVGYIGTGHNSSAATVNGEEISQNVFQQRYNEEYQRLSNQLGDKFIELADSPEFINRLRRDVLTQLVNQELLRQYVKRLHLAVSDAQIKRAIVEDKNFYQNGKFSNELYLQVLNGNHLTPSSYADIVRENVVLDQLQQGILASNFIVPAQQEEFTRLYFQKRTAQLAVLPLVQEIAKQTVSEQEMQDYYNANKNKFVEPERVKVQYINLNREALLPHIEVPDVEAAQYYQDNKALFMQQRLAHIQLANEQQANEVYQTLKDGVDFAKLAKEYSLDKPSAAQGGDLGWINASSFPEDFINTANSLVVGQYSKPVKLNNSYHIIKVLERKEQPLDQVKAEIVNKIKNDMLTNEFFRIEKVVDEKAFEDQSSLSSAEKASGIKVEETGYFSRNDIPSVLNYTNVVSSLFDSDLVNGGANSNVISVGDQHSIVFRVLEHKPEGIKPFEQAKTQIEDYLKHQKAEKIVIEQANKLVKDFEKNVELAEGINFGVEQTFTYANLQDKILGGTIFEMPKPAANKSIYRTAHNSQGDIVIVKLNKVENGVLSKEQSEILSKQLTQTQQNDLQSDLIKMLRDEAKIEVNDGFINQEEIEE